MELERICWEEWDEVHKYRGEKLVETLTNQIVLDPKVDPTEYWSKGLNNY